MILYEERYLGTVLNNAELAALKTRLINGKPDKANSGKKGSTVETKVPHGKKLLKMVEPLTDQEAPL